DNPAAGLKARNIIAQGKASPRATPWVNYPTHSSMRGENVRRHPLHVRQPVIHGRGQTAEAVANAAAKADRGGLGKVTRGATDLSDGVAEPENLGQHLVVKNEIIGVGFQGQSLQQGPRKGAVAGVILGEFGSQYQV